MKLGLVLSGGGARGAYQIGVWKALNKLKIDRYITGISGVSIGALNSMFLIQDDIEIAEEIWESITLEKILPTDNIDIMARGMLLSLGSKKIEFIKKYMPQILEKGNISRDWLIRVISNYLDFNKIISQKRTCYVTCTELSNLEARYFKVNNYSKEEIKNILLATSALPIIYQSEKIEGKKYLDGAISDNIPIQPLYREGFDLIIVVHLSKDGFVNKFKFSNAKFIEIRPTSEKFLSSDILNFSKENIKTKIKEGYDDTLNLFEPIIKIIKLQIEKLPGKIVVNVAKELKSKSLKFKKLLKHEKNNE